MVPALFVLGSTLFFLQAARRHWAFASGGMDLGLFYQTQWLVAHGLPPNNTVLGMHALADHMLFGEFLLARFLHLYEGPETLLFVQAVAVASGVFPLYWLGGRYLDRPRGAVALPLLWLLAPDVHSGLLFDYNPTTIGATVLLWVAWALACRGPVAALVAVLGACAIKENLCLYVAILALVLATRLISWRRASAVVLLCLAVFAVEMIVLFPWFRDGGFHHWEYEDLGPTPREMLVAAAADPGQAVGLLVNDQEKRRSILQDSLQVAARVLAPSVEALDAPLGTKGSRPPPGACYPALRCLPGRDFHPLDRCSVRANRPPWTDDRSHEDAPPPQATNSRSLRGSRTRSPPGQQRGQDDDRRPMS